MQEIDLKKYYDVVVIGAGVGGLTAAALLSKAGFSVCVLEMADHPGGYLAGFRRKHFRFDTAIHWLNQCAPGGMATRIFDILGSDHPIAKPQKRIRRYKGDEHDYLLTNNPDELKARFIEEAPEDKEGIEKFFAAAKRLGGAFANFNKIFRTEESMNMAQRMMNKRNLLKFAIPFIPFLKYDGEEGIQKGLNKFFKSKTLQRIFSPDLDLLSCLVPIGWAYYGDYQSPPEGGGQVIPEWLEHVVHYYNSETYYKCKVKEVLLEGNTAKGVAFECRGKHYEAHSKYVLAACDLETVYEKMLPESVVPEKIKQKLKDAVLYSSSVTVSIALDCPPGELGFNEELIHLSSETVPRGQHCDGDPHKSEISILAPSLRDKTLAPEGQGTLVLFMPAYMDYENEWKTEKDEKGAHIRGTEYKDLKHSIAEVLIQRVNDHIAPKLREHILFYDVATPVTHNRYTGNRNGTMMGAKPGRQNMQNKVAKYHTPVKNLLISGHWAELGGGVPIAVKSGTNAALLVLQKENKGAFKVLANYMDGKTEADAVLHSKYFKPYDNSWVRKPTPAEKLAARQETEQIEKEGE